MLYFEIPEDRSWRVFQIEKRHSPGEFRTITAPNKELKRVQRVVLESMSGDKRLRPPVFPHGFVRHRSTITGVQRHNRKGGLIKLDVESFFDNFPVKAVKDRLLEVGYEEELVDRILELCTYNNTIPQGGPCSPFLTNVGMFHTDLILGDYAKKNNMTYSRYADDLSFVYNENVTPEEEREFKDHHIKAIAKILWTRLGLKLKKKKISFTQQGSPYAARKLTGIVIRNDGKGYNAPRKFRANTRAAVCNLAHKVEAQKGRMTDADHRKMAEIVGRVRYMDGVRIRGGGDEDATTADPRIQEKYWDYLMSKWKSH